ncbi:hypothetical protein ABZW18_26165 [Streptomyces sp. NPDC004647]|uniref:hypothetical protein n=1 Tax=Streptomyces sp. NPDC004647 TaxID=3154671 RepID=UPI0033AE29A8
MDFTMDNAPYRVDLIKRLATYYVLADDREAFTSWADHKSEDRQYGREVLHVERVTDHPEERQAQRNKLEGVCRDDHEMAAAYLAGEYAAGRQRRHLPAVRIGRRTEGRKQAGRPTRRKPPAPSRCWGLLR